MLGKLHKVSESVPIELLKGPKGDPGPQGERGPEGPRGRDGADGKDGKDGRDGKDGKDGVTKVVHEYQELPDNLATVEQLLKEKEKLQREIEMLKTRSTSSSGFVGGDTGTGNNTYTLVQQAEYHVVKSQLSYSTNIFGVNYAGDVTIYLPKNIDKRSVIVVNDESDNAGTYNITVVSEE